MVSAHTHKGSWKRQASAVNRELAEAAEAVKQAHRDEWKATQEAHRRAEAERVRFTRDDLLTATLIRTAYGVHKVVRVNQKTVTVATEYSWTETVKFDQVLEWSSAVMV